MQVRFRGSASALDRELGQLIAAAAPDFEIAESATIEALRDKGISQDRLLAFLSTLFGLLGVGLALVGIYGLISYAVTQRTHEIGVRVSVGAQRSQIVRLVLSEAAVLVVFGYRCRGSAGAWVCRRGWSRCCMRWRRGPVLHRRDAGDLVAGRHGRGVPADAAGDAHQSAGGVEVRLRHYTDGDEVARCIAAGPGAVERSSRSQYLLD